MRGARQGATSTSLYTWLVAAALSYLPTLFLIGRHPLWRDEVVTAVKSSRPFAQMVNELGNSDVVLGLYYLIVRPISVVTTEEGWLRLPSWIGIIIAAALIGYTAAYLTKQRGVGALAVLLTAANTATWGWANEARPYALAVAAGALLTLQLLKALRVEPTRTQALAYGVVATLALYLQMIIGLLLAVHALALVFEKEFVQARRRYGIALLVAFIVAGPLALEGLSQSGQVSWIPLTSATSIAKVAIHLTGGASLWSVAVLALVGLGVVMALPGIRHDPQRKLLLASVVLPVTALALLGLRVHVFEPRYLAFVIPPGTELAAIGFSRLRNEALAVVTAMLIVLWVKSPLEVWDEPYKHEDFRSAVAYFTENHEPGDRVAFDPSYSRIGFSFYLPDDIEVRQVVFRRGIEPILDPDGRVWIVGLATTIDPPVDVEAELNEDGFEQVEQRAFGDLEIRLFTSADAGSLRKRQLFAAR